MNHRYNILWIVLDHVTFRHYMMTRGARPVLNTYERITSRGIAFTNCHSTHPLCLPARASMLTGMYTSRHGKLDNGRYPDAGYPLISQYLAQAGYRTGYFGKNHSGYEHLSNYGFEGFFPEGYGNPYLSDEYKAYLAENDLSHPIYAQEWSVETDHKLWPNGEYDLTRENNFNTYTAGVLKTPGPVHESDFLVSRASRWMSQRIQSNETFFTRVDIWGPHHAFQVPAEYADLISASEIEEYPSFRHDMRGMPAFSVAFRDHINRINPLKTWEQWRPVMKRAYEHYSYIDKTVGKLLDQLEKLDALQDTVIIYTADHGDSLASHGGLIDKSGDMLEEVMHIPLVIQYPGVPGGRKSDRLVSNLDLMPTVLEIAGVTPEFQPDGKSLVPLITGADVPWRENLMAQHYGHFDNHVAQRALYHGPYKYVACDGYTDQLYDLGADPFELRNLVDDAAYLPVLKSMARRLLDEMNAHGDRDERVRPLRKKIQSLF